MDCGEKVLWCLVLLALFTGVGRVDGWTNVTGQWLNNQCNKFDKYKCGDVCRDRTKVYLYMRPCECGGEKYDWFSHWCCKSPQENCSTDFSSARQVSREDYNAEIDCQGKVIPNNQLCHGKCKPSEQWIRFDGLMIPVDQFPGHQRACSANISSPCVDALELCHGEPMCHDKSDLRWCLDDNYANLKGAVTHCTRHIRSQLVDYQDMYDGQYHCLDRSDEDPFLLYDQRINASSTLQLESCNNATRPSLWPQGSWWSSYGYMTEEQECTSVVFWCNRRSSVGMTSLEVISPRICQDFSLWRDKSCGGPKWIRCFGHWSGQCISTGRIE